MTTGIKFWKGQEIIFGIEYSKSEYETDLSGTVNHWYARSNSTIHDIVRFVNPIKRRKKSRRSNYGRFE